MSKRPHSEARDKPDSADSRYDWNGGDFGFYMSEKVRKLRHQFAADATSRVFHGVSIFVDGRTVPNRDVLRDTVTAGSGTFENYFSRSAVTHVIVQHLPHSKIAEMRALQAAGIPVVLPAWIVQSAAQGRLLPVTDFPVPGLRDRSQTALAMPSAQPVNRPHTSILASNQSPTFVRDFFNQSRLSFIGSFRARYEAVLAKVAAEHPAGSLPALLAQARVRAAELAARNEDRTIVHVDLDCAFASAAIARDPSLRNKPIAVCHSDAGGRNAATSRSEISSANYLARAAGLRAGMFLGDAIKMCPALVTVPYDFAAYEAIGWEMCRTFFSITPLVETVSVDEAYLDVTGVTVTDEMVAFVNALPDSVAPIVHQTTTPTAPSPTNADTLVRYIRAQIFNRTGCPASAGAGPNKLIARLATKRAKPDGQFKLTAEGLPSFLADKRVDEVPGVGWRTSEKLQEMGICTCSQLRSLNREVLQARFGEKLGVSLYESVRGIDDRPVEVLQTRKSVSAEVRWGVRFNVGPEEDAKRQKFIRDIVEVVVERLGEATASKLTYTALQRKPGAGEPWKVLGHGLCDEFSKSATLTPATGSVDEIARVCLSLHSTMNIPNTELRGVGLQLTNLHFSWEKHNEQSLHRFFNTGAGDRPEQADNNTGRPPGGDQVRPPNEPEPGEDVDEVVAVPAESNEQDLREAPAGDVLDPSEIELPSDLTSIDTSVLQALPEALRRGIQRRLSTAVLAESRGGGVSSDQPGQPRSTVLRPVRARASRSAVSGTGSGQSTLTQQLAGSTGARGEAQASSRRAAVPLAPPGARPTSSKQRRARARKLHDSEDVLAHSSTLKSWMREERTNTEAAAATLWTWMCDELEGEMFARARNLLRLVGTLAGQVGGGWPGEIERLQLAFDAKARECIGGSIDL